MPFPPPVPWDDTAHHAGGCPVLVDTHAHLQMPDFAADLEEVLGRARSAGVAWILTVGTDLASSRRAVELARRHPMLRAAVGVHPHEAASVGPETLAELECLARGEGVAAVGETGLDYYRDLSPRRLQREAFLEHLDLARRCDLPVVIHCREAYDDLPALVREAAPAGLKGVCHCFSGDRRAAETLIGMGLCISFTGTITFPNARRLREVVRAVPLERTLVETDCPYLAPQARRGRRNEPANVRMVAAEVARIHGVTLEAVAAATTAAAEALFAPSGSADIQGADIQG